MHSLKDVLAALPTNIADFQKRHQTELNIPFKNKNKLNFDEESEKLNSILKTNFEFGRPKHILTATKVSPSKIENIFQTIAVKLNMNSVKNVEKDSNFFYWIIFYAAC